MSRSLLKKAVDIRFFVTAVHDRRIPWVAGAGSAPVFTALRRSVAEPATAVSAVMVRRCKNRFRSAVILMSTTPIAFLEIL
jgi:hypothetical protein